jgi:hypothetical protein
MNKIEYSYFWERNTEDAHEKEDAYREECAKRAMEALIISGLLNEYTTDGLAKKAFDMADDMCAERREWTGDWVKREYIKGQRPIRLKD